MPRPTPITTTDELLVELVDEVVGLRQLLRDRLPAPDAGQQPIAQAGDGAVELREPDPPPANAPVSPPRQPDPPATGPAAHPDAPAQVELVEDKPSSPARPAPAKAAKPTPAKAAAPPAEPAKKATATAKKAPARKAGGQTGGRHGRGGTQS
jgi:outer membrane biosynthesis protein TonB